MNSITENSKIHVDILEAFPILSTAKYVREVVNMDSIARIYLLDSGKHIAFIKSDYPDPLSEGRHFKSLPGKDSFEFINLVKPYANDETIDIREHDEMEGDFLISEYRTRIFPIPVSYKGKVVNLEGQVTLEGNNLKEDHTITKDGGSKVHIVKRFYESYGYYLVNINL